MNAGPKQRSARTRGAGNGHPSQRHPDAYDRPDRTSLGQPYFVVPELPAPGPFVLDGTEGRHAATVRRLRIGESLMLTDGNGGQAAAAVTAVGRGELSLDVASGQFLPPPAIQLTLVQAVPKGDRGELAVELATEAGIDSVVPWSAERCVARWKTVEQAAKAVGRWQNTAREAAKQARRPYIPAVTDVASTTEVAALIEQSAAGLILHDAASIPIRSAALPDSGPVILIVGPEGGLTEEELAVFQTAGAVPVRLGPQVLRTSTAGAVALGALGVLTGRWT
ncbi:MAG: 16S rRNA (uracil(1498)-N(3))-methyltransferase [Nakamurella sp.]